MSFEISDNAEVSQDSKGVLIGMKVSENIAAEIEDFILCSRFGLIDQAYQIVYQALWNHLHHFPVFAEVALFLVWNTDLEGLKRLRKEVSVREIRFHDAEEELLLNDVLEMMREVVSDSWQVETRFLSLSITSAQPVPVHRYLIWLRFLTWQMTVVRNRPPWRWERVTKPLANIRRLVAAGFVWEATCVFSNLCDYVTNFQDDLADDTGLLSVITAAAHCLDSAMTEETICQTYFQLCKVEQELGILQTLASIRYVPRKIEVPRELLRSESMGKIARIEEVMKDILDAHPDRDPGGYNMAYLRTIESWLESRRPQSLPIKFTLQLLSTIIRPPENTRDGAMRVLAAISIGIVVGHWLGITLFIIQEMVSLNISLLRLGLWIVVTMTIRTKNMVITLMLKAKSPVLYEWPYKNGQPPGRRFPNRFSQRLPENPLEKRAIWLVFMPSSPLHRSAVRERKYLL